MGQICTHLVLAALAHLTNAAPHTRLQGDAVPNREVGRCGDLRTNLDDLAAALVTKAHGLLHNERSDGTMLEVVDVRAADSRLRDGNKNLVALDFGDWALRLACPAQLVERVGSNHSVESRRTDRAVAARPPASALVPAVNPQTITHLLDLDIVNTVEDKAGVVGLELSGSRHFVLVTQNGWERKDKRFPSGKIYAVPSGSCRRIPRDNRLSTEKPPTGLSRRRVAAGHVTGSVYG